jgi:hypothetical protein
LAKTRFCFVNKFSAAAVVVLELDDEEEASTIDKTINEVAGPCQCPLLILPLPLLIVILGKRISITVELLEVSLIIGSHPEG